MLSLNYTLAITVCVNYLHWYPLPSFAEVTRQLTFREECGSFSMHTQCEMPLCFLVLVTHREAAGIKFSKILV